MRRFGFLLGCTLMVAFLLTALLAPVLAPYTPGTKILSEQLQAPSMAHWLGQNQHGEDLLTLLIYGARISLLVSLSTVIISLFVGVTVGLVSGTLGGWMDALLSRAMEIVQAFPGILLAIAISAVLGPSLVNVVIALVVGGWVPFARLVRGLVLSLKQRPFVSAAKSMGAGLPRIMFGHLLPNLWGPLIVQATFALASAILAESSLSFLGLGVASGTPSWGAAVSDGTRYLLTAPHVATFPGVAIMLAVLGLNFFGDGLRDKILGR